MSLPSVMTHQFSRIPQANIPRSTFNRTHSHKTAFDAGYLIPIYVDEALPGDTFNLDMTAFARLSTPLHPVMDNMYLDLFFFAVPNRLVWDNWHKFCGAQDDPADSTDFTIPVMTTPGGGYAENSLSDYFGIPTKIAGLGNVACLHHRAYNLIWNEWFRDENLQNSVTVDKDNGPDTDTDYVLLRRGKRHDYFTSCLPWPQKGDAVSIPLGTDAPVTGIGTLNGTWATGPVNAYETDAAGVVAYANYKEVYNPSSNNMALYLEEDPNNATYPNIRADLSNATAATINALRTAFQQQKLYERDARGGTRYTEIVRSHFGVVSPDARLQRPEYLGGATAPITITPIPQVSETNTTPQGFMGGFGTMTARGGFTKSFTEHCVLIGLANVRADLTYSQGVPRMFMRSTRWDYYWPGLAHIGEQSVTNREIYAQGTGDDATVFGYQERYAEYRYYPSKITGVMRPNATTSLETWHLSEEFGSLPTLGSTFIQDDPPVDRVIITPTEPHVIFDSHIRINSARPMPVYGVPGLIDHF